MNKLQKLGVFVFTNYLYYNVIGMGKIASKHKKKKVLLYSAILSLMLSGNNSAIAEDLPIPVSTGPELKSAIEKASNTAKIQFEKDIDISSLDRINVGAKKIEIDGDGKSLTNEKDSRFIFSNGSNLTLKNMQYTGKNSSINVDNANTTISLENVDISGRTTSAVQNGPVLFLKDCDATLNNVSVSSSRVNIQNNSINGGAINIQTAKSKGTITDLIDNQITSAGNVYGGLIYNRRTLTPIGELNLNGDVNKNKITAKAVVYGGILNNENSSVQSINWNEVTGNTITTNNSVIGGFIYNKLGKIDNLHIGSFSNNEINSNLKIDGGLIYNESGTVNNTLEIGQIVGNTITAQTDINGLITNVTGTMNSISIDSVSGNKFKMNFLRGGVINLQGANVNDINIGEINNNTIIGINDNTIIGRENSTSTGFVLYLRESPKDSTISSNIGNLTVGQIHGNSITATNITSLLLRSALVPVENATVISKNGDVTVNEISNNTLTAIDCNDNARGGIIYNFLHGGIKTTNTTVSLGDINLEHVSNNHLESTISTSTSGETRALSGRHASGTIIANSIQSCQGNAIIKSINGEYVGNSLFSNSKVMDASGGVISNSVNGQGNAFVGIGYTLDENNKIIPVADAILGTYKNNYVQSKELSANGGVIANYVESSKNNDIAQIGNIKAYFEGNYVLSKNDSAYGGAIANFYVKSQNDYKNAIIDSINGTFENNHAKTESTDSSNGAYGGAISNTATLKAINNSIFKNNYAISNGGSNAFGGAIYTKQDLTINANDNGLTEFTGNYVSTDGGATKNYEAINVDASGKTLTLNATTGGTILLNDYINGVSGYNVLLTGDDTGTIKLYNNADIKGGANVTVGGNVVIDTADGIIQNFSKFNSLNSDANAKYNIDLDLSKANSGQSNYTIGDKIADGFTTQTSSGGTITIDNLNIIDNSFDDILNKKLKIQIIQNNDKTDSLQLALSDKLTSTADKITQIVSTKKNPLTPTANYKDLFGDITTTKDIYGTLGLGKTNTTNDSLNITVTKVDTNTAATIADALVALTNTELKDSDGNILDKTFNLFDEDSLGNKTPASYKVSDSLGSIYKNLNIVGATKTDSLGERILSELDLDEKTSFVVNSGSTLNISDIKLTGNETVITNNNGNLNFTNNNIIDGKITGTTATNTGVLGINANNLDVALTNNGTLNLGEGNVEKEITGSGSTNILDAVTNNAVISQNVNVNGSGKLKVNANIGNLTNNGEVTSSTSNLTGTINNSGTLNLSGTLNKEISGLGTTKIVGDSFTMLDGAVVKGVLDINNQTLNVLATNTENMFNDVNINSGTLNIINNGINNLSANSFKISGNVNLLLDADLKNSVMDRLPSTTVVNGLINVKGINLLSDSTSEKTYIPFAYDSFKDKVQTNITTVGKDVNNEYQTTTFAPIYKYDVSYNPNNGNFLFSRGGGKSSADFNPAVLSGAVNSQVGAYSAVNETFNYAFRHADYSFMPLPKRIRTLANKYAITEPRSIRYENDYSKAGGIWYQPYANFENVGLSNGPRVDIQSYGSLIGGDSSYKQLKRGWGTVTTPYIGYNGTSQSYSGVSTTTNGGILGLTQTFYHGDFYTALTINAGASNGESSTMYGKENYTALMAGIGSKTGYNFEFNDGKLIIQPSMLMAYTYVNTFDYTNAAGVKISSDPLHSIQLHPSIKFMGNVGKGWQPYASVGMVWNILNETNFTANNVRLPEMSIRPYVEYGVGLQKIWHDKCTGFVQAMLRNGGRNGIALTFGFKWAVGKDNKPIERVQNNTKHVLKVHAAPTQSLEKSPQSIAVQSPIIPIQKVNNLPKNVIQTSNNTASLNSRLNILTPQQLAQRANFNITTSTPKTIKTSQLLKY